MTFLAATAGLAVASAPCESAAQSLSDSRSTAIVRAARTVAPAVVTISVLRRERVRRRSFFDDYYLPFRETRGLGSGFIVNAAGTVLTNHHVIEDATEVLVTLPDGRDFDARVAGSDPTTDVAVIVLDEAPDLPVAPLGTASDLLIGEWTVAIGNPFGGLISNPEPSVTAGVVSALGRHIIPGQDDDGFYLGMIQTDAAINPGNSGGPLVNALGEVIGINTSILSRSGGSEGLGFAIPIDRALKVARDLAEHGEVRRAWLGLEVDAVEADAFGRSRGVRVARVTPGSPAAVAGIRPGARLLQAGASRMATPLDYAAVLLDLGAGDRIELAVEGMDAVQLRAAPLPSATADRVELLRDLQVVTVTAGIRAERGLASSEGALVVEISDALAGVTGLATGDVLLAVNNMRVRTAREAADELRRIQRAGRSCVLRFERNGRMVRTGLLEWR
ncbi:MAG: trypsin-like peptidase domain-containing protein [Gemmatimonadetes bacterium]|nr:trypsin-like peptidase domain-containing protein [Gemmatimonadota bacterium]